MDSVEIYLFQAAQHLLTYSSPLLYQAFCLTFVVSGIKGHILLLYHMKLL